MHKSEAASKSQTFFNSFKKAIDDSIVFSYAAIAVRWSLHLLLARHRPKEPGAPGKDLDLPEEAPLEEVKAAFSQELGSWEDKCHSQPVLLAWQRKAQARAPAQRQTRGQRAGEEAGERHLAMKGERNSCSRTCPDATFVREGRLYATLIVCACRKRADQE